MEKHNFLSIDYGSLGFIINRARLDSSCYLENEVKTNSPSPYFDLLFDYGGQYILVFNMHGALGELFNFQDESKTRLLLIARLETGPAMLNKICNGIDTNGKMINRELIGIRIKSASRMTVLPTNELRLLPASLKNVLKNYGILACYFPSRDRIQYLIEVDNICSKFVQEALEDEKEK